MAAQPPSPPPAAAAAARVPLPADCITATPNRATFSAHNRTLVVSVPAPPQSYGQLARHACLLLGPLGDRGLRGVEFTTVTSRSSVIWPYRRTSASNNNLVDCRCAAALFAIVVLCPYPSQRQMRRVSLSFIFWNRVSVQLGALPLSPPRPLRCLCPWPPLSLHSAPLTVFLVAEF